MSMSKFVDHLDYAASLASKGRQKPVVKYAPIGFAIEPGFRATVRVVSHPDPLIDDGEVVHTSTVQAVDPNTGRFETRNTIYELQS
jgi:P pilus assembly chaperone PapD